jgi:glutamine phosphoribosylpyrophosphate amidotransferase
MEKAISALRIQAMHIEAVDYDRVISFIDSIVQATTSRRIIENEDVNGAVSRAVDQ